MRAWYLYFTPITAAAVVWEHQFCIIVLFLEITFFFFWHKCTSKQPDLLWMDTLKY